MIIYQSYNCGRVLRTANTMAMAPRKIGIMENAK